MLNQVSRIALASAIIGFGAQSALALDGDDFGAKLKAAVALQGLAFYYAEAAVDGETVTLSDLTLFIPGEDGASVPGDVVFSGVIETADGGYTVETATIADIEVDDLDDGASFALRNVKVENITIPGAIDYADLLPAAMSLYERVSAGPLTITVEDGEAEAFAIDSMSVWIENNPDNPDIVSGFAIEGMRIDFANIPEPEAQEVMEEFGASQVGMALTAISTWNPETGRAAVDDFALTLDNLATLRITGSVLGYTTELYQEIIKANVKMAGLAEAGESVNEQTISASEDAMLALLSQFEIEKLAIRYEDASLFMKILDFAGKEQGVDGETFASGLKFMVPMMLTEVPDADFRAQVTRAVNAFIDNPQNIEIAADPETPVTMDDLAIAEDDPFALIDLLNVTITANQ